MKTEQEKKSIMVTVHIKDVPKEIRQHFKAKCGLLGLTMREASISLWKEFIKR